MALVVVFLPRPGSASASGYFAYDCWPGISGTVTPAICDNKSNTYGYVSSGGGATGYGNIQWDYDTGDVTVFGWLTDHSSNGHGPVVKLTLSGGDYPDVEYLHDTHGASSTQYEYTQVFRAAPFWNSAALTIQMCDGFDASGDAINCSSVHGPFHHPA